MLPNSAASDHEFRRAAPSFLPSTLLRIEVLLEAVPICTVALLKRFGLGGKGRNPLWKASLKHEGHCAFELVRLQLGVARAFEGVHIGPMREHGIVERNSTRREALRLRVVLAIDQAHELAHDVHVVPRRPEGVFRNEPSVGEDHKIDIDGLNPTPTARRDTADRTGWSG